MKKYDFESLWRILISIVLSLLAISLIFIGQAISHYGNAITMRLDVLQQKVNMIQQNAACTQNNPSAGSNVSSIIVEPSEEQKNRVGNIMTDMQNVLKNSRTLDATGQ